MSVDSFSYGVEITTKIRIVSGVSKDGNIQFDRRKSKTCFEFDTMQEAMDFIYLSMKAQNIVNIELFDNSTGEVLYTKKF